MTTRLERDRKAVRNTYATADQDPGTQRFRGLSFDTWLEEERQAAIAAASKPATPDHAALAAEHVTDAEYMSGQAQAVALALASVEANLATAQAVERLNDNMAELAQGLLAKAAEASREPDGSNLSSGHAFSDVDLNRMAQRFYEVASQSGEVTFPRMSAKPAIVDALQAALEYVGRA